MKIISHRGNLNGPNSLWENSPHYIDEAIRKGFDVEVDVRYIDGKFYLGHDTPDYEVSQEWLEDRRDRLWIHCKNFVAASILMKSDPSIKCFCGADDPFLIVHPHHLWVQDFDEMEPTERCIATPMTLTELREFKFYDKVYGVCTDYAAQVTQT